MKKSVLVVALAFGVTGAFAQDLTSKKGEPILPEAEDWAISMDANPIFNYVGNAFNGSTSNSAPGTGWLNSDQTIIGKKFIDEKNAYRVLVRLGFTSTSTKAMIGDASATGTLTYPAVPAMKEDKMKSGNTNIGIGVGKEMRRGKTRLQGVYGADAMIWMSSSKQKYEYGNALSNSATAPVAVGAGTTTNFGSNIGTDTYGNAARTTVNKSGMTFGIGVRAFIGAEYFIFPKISVGAEYGWGIGYQMTGKGKKTVESLDSGTNAVGTQDTQTSGSSKFGFDTDINNGTLFGFHGSGSGSTGSGSLRVTFHF
ncbi:MAG: hypothetical protein ACJ77K_04420 [Bacteroidia bacterium]